MIMNNRMDEFIAPDQDAVESPEEPPFAAGEIADYMNLARDWAIRNPLPCLAAAFVAGVTLAWIIKRK
jgi:hypothetical protein